MIKVEKLGTRYWAVMRITGDSREILHDCLSKKDALKYIYMNKIS